MNNSSIPTRGSSVDSATRYPPHQVALIWASRGFPVFPIRVSPHPTEPRRLDKKPLTAHGHLDASTNPDPDHYRGANGVGLRPGPAGYLVLDVDMHGGDGLALARELELPQTWTSDSPSQGEHGFYEHPGGHIGNTTPWPGLIDVRADAGWVVAPGTCTPYGSWRARTPFTPNQVTRLSPHIIEAVRQPVAPVRGCRPWLPWMVKWMGRCYFGSSRDVWNAKEGNRNNELAKHAGYAARKLAGSSAPQSAWATWEDHFTKVGLRVGLSRDEVERTLIRARAYGFEKPHPIGTDERMQTRLPAKAWLQGWMTDRGEVNVPRSEVVNAGRDAGYSDSAIDRAAKRLAMRVADGDAYPRRTLWSLPCTGVCVPVCPSAKPCTGVCVSTSAPVGPVVPVAPSTLGAVVPVVTAENARTAAADPEAAAIAVLADLLGARAIG